MASDDAVPQSLNLVTPNEYRNCAGVFDRVDGIVKNGFPAWEKRDTKPQPLALFSVEPGRWCVGSTNNDYRNNRGWMLSGAHEGALPPALNGSWERMNPADRSQMVADADIAIEIGEPKAPEVVAEEAVAQAAAEDAEAAAEAEQAAAAEAAPAEEEEEEAAVPAEKLYPRGSRKIDPWVPLTLDEHKAKLKDVRREGWRIGVDCEGANHMGNTQFFCSSVKEPKGDLEMIVESVKAMNTPEPKVVRAHMERKGCSGHLGKIITSANANQIAVLAYVPKALQESLTPRDWLQEVMEWYGGEILQESEEQCAGLITNLSGNGIGYEILLRHHCTDVLQKMQLMAGDDHAHHHDDEIFGDEDLPGMSEERKKSIFVARKSIMQQRKSIYG